MNSVRSPKIVRLGRVTRKTQSTFMGPNLEPGSQVLRYIAG